MALPTLTSCPGLFYLCPPPPLSETESYLSQASIEHGMELKMTLLSQVLGLQTCTTISGLCGTEDGTQGFGHARQTVYPLSHIHSPGSSIYNPSQSNANVLGAGAIYQNPLVWYLVQAQVLGTYKTTRSLAVGGG